MPAPRSQADSPRTYYSVSGQGVALHVNARALAALDALVRDALRSSSRRGFEIGGLLLGSDAPGSWLEAVYPLPIERRFGPSCELLFRQAVRQLQQSGARVIGHFRSHTSGGFEITDQDGTLADFIGEAPSW